MVFTRELVVGFARELTITMTRAEALVLFEFLARYDESEKLDIQDPAEEFALWQVHGAFERVLVEPFEADYRERLEAARETVRRAH
ncbi:MAG TPA: hypothetical protein VES89_13660 [Candidatus Competibacteraceae bacterium]|nr:hypothetical protein [Candidatus Competibacteraceae bacterium]